MYNIFLCGGDEIDWALDEDLQLLKEAIAKTYNLTPLQDAEIILSVCWESLLKLNPDILHKKKVLCAMSGEPFRYLTMPKFNNVLPYVDMWMARSTQAKEQLDLIGVNNNFLPYAVDCSIFFPLSDKQDVTNAFKEKYNIPSNAYLIGSFQRDTEELDFSSPKLVKGPDVFLEIVLQLYRRGKPIHIVLAGPRRHWMKQQLANYKIPYTYVGKDILGDDIEQNTLSRSKLNELYNSIDLYLIASRFEDGPYTLLEATAAKCKVVSSGVGIAFDLLTKNNIFSSLTQAVDVIERDISENTLEKELEKYLAIVQGKHSVSALSTALQPILEEVHNCETPTTAFYERKIPAINNSDKNWLSSICFFVRHRKRPSDLVVGLWHNFVPPPYGGGNQFMLALEKGLTSLGVQTVRNQFDSYIDAYIINAVQFPLDKFMAYPNKEGIPILHRIDGPISLVRGFDKQKDDLCFMINNKYANATVLQSNWIYKSARELGYNVVNPTIIRNTVNPDYFHSRGKVEFERCRKIRLISSAWSPNVRKGGPLYKWLDENLDWSRYEYTFVGRVSEENFKNITMINPVPSKELGHILREHDIYITASQNDPCSNAVIEALSCGLPVLYLNSGGHPELVGYGGLGFNSDEDVLLQLGKLVQDYDMYRRLIYVPTLKDISIKYLDIIKNMVN